MSAREPGGLSGQLVRFAAIGGIGAVIDIGGTMLLLAAGWSPVVARGPAFACAVVATWYFHGTYTFRARDRLSAGNLGLFSGLAVLIAAVNYLIYAGLVIRETWPPLAIVVATAISMGISFFAYRFVAFR